MNRKTAEYMYRY